MDDSEWYVANSYDSPDGSARVQELHSWNERGAPFRKWRVVSEGGEYELPGTWRGEPEFTGGGKFALLLDSPGETFRVVLDPLRRTFTLPARGEESLHDFQSRVSAYYSTYHSLAERGSEVFAQSVATSLLLAVLSLVLTVGSILVLLYLDGGWEAWAGSLVFILFTIGAFYDLWLEVKKKRERRQARVELDRLRGAGP